MSAFQNFLSSWQRLWRLCLSASGWLLPLLSLAYTPLPAYPPVLHTWQNEPAVHLVLRLNADELQLHTQEGLLLMSQPRTRRVIINNPYVQSLTLDFRNGTFAVPVVYQGNRQQNAHLIIQGGHFPQLAHILKDAHSGYLDFDQDGQPDVQYEHVAEVHLYVEANTEVRVETPQPQTPTSLQRLTNPPRYRLSSVEQKFPATIVPAGPGHVIGLFSPSAL